MEPLTNDRHIAALLGFLQKFEVDAIFKQQPFRPQEDGVVPLDLWRKSTNARQSLSPLATTHSLSNLPDSLRSRIEVVRARKTYQESYEAIADYQFGLAPIAGLLAPQWIADLDYIDELATQAPQSDDQVGAFEFSFCEGEIAEPVVTANQVVFGSHRRDLHCNPVPTVRKIASGEYEIVVRAISRPNYVQVAVINNRLFLANGVHKVLALFRTGASHVPCVWRQINSLSEAIDNPQGTTLFTPQTFNGPRPALGIDFLDPALASPILMRGMDQVLRVGIGTELFCAPSLPEASTSTQRSNLLLHQATSKTPSKSDPQSVGAGLANSGSLTQSR